MSQKTEADIKYWWVTASDGDPIHGWHWDRFFEDYNNPMNFFNWGGPDWIRSTVSFARIKAMREGNIVVAYQAQVGVVGLAYLGSDGRRSSPDGKFDTFDLRPMPNLRLERSISLEDIRNSRNASTDFEFVRVRRGSVFAITPRGFDTLLSLIQSFNPRQKRQLAAFLKPRGAIVEAKVAAIDSLDKLTAPERQELFTQRIIRDSRTGKELKTLYNYQCQICGQTIELPDGRRYAEVHHLRPVGAPHNGKDGVPNMIVVCPQHHAMLDLGAIAIEPKSMTVEHWDSQNRQGLKLQKHKLDASSLKYHYKYLFKR